MPSRIAFIALDRFEVEAKRVPELIRDLARLLARRQREAVRYAEGVPFQSLETRLARALLGIARSPPASAGLCLTQEALAAMIGISRQTGYRHLKALEAMCVFRRCRPGIPTRIRAAF